jgi:hypothetical protein
MEGRAMNRINMRVRRGAPITFGNVNTGPGDPALLTQRKAVLRRAGPGLVVDESAPVAADFVVTFRAATVDVAAGFNFSIDADTSKTLAAGIYAVNGALGAAGVPVVITDPLFIQIEETTTDDVV